jgi:DNA polymerase I
MSRKKIFLLDVLPLIYRAHFAMINQSLYNSAGVNTSPVLGFCNFLFQIIFKENPTHIAAAFDHPAIERKANMQMYKANREKAPEDVSVALNYVKSIVNALNIKRIELRGFEADDVLGTIAVKAAADNCEVYIVSPDKDLAQLVNDNIFLYRPPFQGTNFEILDPIKVQEKYGVPPSQIADFLALKGDPTDNIPGVPKIGEKTATELLKSYGSVEAVLEHREEITKSSIRETLHNNQEIAMLSKQTALINSRLPLKFDAEDFKIKSPDFNELDKLLDELEFKKLKERIYAHPIYREFERNQPLKPEVKGKIPVLNKPEILTDQRQIEGILKGIKEFYFQFYYSDSVLYIVFNIREKTYCFQIQNNIFPYGLKRIFEDSEILKVTYDAKNCHKILLSGGIKASGKIMDIMLAHYILNPEGSHQPDIIIGQYYPEIKLPESPQERKAAETSLIDTIYNFQSRELKDEGLYRLYNDIEIPLAYVLAVMELNGIGINTKVLSEIAELLNSRINKIENKIKQLAGEDVNVRSSKQMSEVLAKIVKSETFKKTRGGQFSTAESVLQELSQDYEIAELLLTFRKLDKVVSTYALSLPKFIDRKSGRIHADFKQAVTATGRLSCANPNLQNLPIGTEEGREIRKAVIPATDEFLILSADYSQIELRLLAALCKDEALVNAFRNNLDIHTITAAKVFHVNEDEVNSSMRSKAKMVNYGIAYGISPFGLGQNLKIKQTEAKEIIDNYFSEFPAIKIFIDWCINEAKSNGFTRTITGRRRFLQDINSRNGTVRKMAERIAINAPIQGLAADLIKIAMIEIQKCISEKKLKSRLIMQIHDELVFEVHKDEVSQMKVIVKEKMEHAIDLNVPLEVNISAGKNWLDQEELK